ncbi:HpcH/HpaI aldolase family protein [Gordonia rhizosphera]|uniref:Putative aldolase n=1 Tax=Gordonia rhizosphera NBRC 16068 TaxID=1108045 RepID=K6X0N3_9ACTN|nr:aldolase/citrate lyase family protein [Gordonia rhizosphera]GAB92334.1 putative aldolase [Gordonia rhizosphera NBRC 16068]
MNVIQKALAAGRPTYGIWMTAPSNISAEVLGRGPWDWILLDMQHGSIDAGNLLPMIQAVELGGGATLVRVAVNEPSLIMRALDLGAIGVVVPMVSTPEQARAAADATRYPPLGTRSFGPIRNFYGVEAASASTTCLVMIETVEGLDNVEAIAATPGVDGLFVGPMDLGLSLGEGLDGATPGNRVVSEAIARIVAAADAHGIFVGVAGMGAEHTEELLKAGVRLVTMGSDIGYLSAGLSVGARRIDGWNDRFRNVR